MTALEIINAQLQILWLYLQRPAVQVQIVAIVLVVLLALGLTGLLQRLVKRFIAPAVAAAEDQPQMEATPEHPQHGISLWRLRRWIYITQPIYLPALGLILSQIAYLLIISRTQPVGLLLGFQVLLLLFLAYRGLTALLVSRLRPADAKFYDRFLLLPIFALLTAGLLLGSLSLRDVLLAFPLPSLFDIELTVGGAINFVLIIYFAFVLARLVRDVLHRTMQHRTQLDPDLEKSIVNTGRNLTIAGGILLALGSLGFSLTALSFIAGGLSVGIGTGLNKIAANFVSGILLWSDETVRMGDVIEINSEMGTIEKMGIRSTIVRTLDNVELIVPNEDFMTQVVVAYTKSSRIVRIAIEIGVGYGSDGSQVRELLLEIAADHGLVKKDPEPLVFFTNFGTSALNFKMLVWVDEPTQVGQVTSDLNFMILRRFRNAGIEIPFPQQDVRVAVENWPASLTAVDSAPEQEPEERDV